MPAPVAVVGAAADGILGGLTAAWVTRVSMAPPLLMVSIGHERYTWELLAAAEEFTVSLLAEGQVAEARLFGLKSRRDEDKWSQVDHVLMGGGVPALAHCSARFLCSIKHRFATGDHDCFVGLIASAEIVAGAPPLPLRGSDFA
jgi:flavin reductase (DIM6/NTAB) family NADH-FMN oxidoreductase RutF